MKSGKINITQLQGEYEKNGFTLHEEHEKKGYTDRLGSLVSLMHEEHEKNIYAIKLGGVAHCMRSMRGTVTRTDWGQFSLFV